MASAAVTLSMHLCHAHVLNIVRFIKWFSSYYCNLFHAQYFSKILIGSLLTEVCGLDIFQKFQFSNIVLEFVGNDAGMQIVAMEQLQKLHV